jgi:hypothetical protein
MEAIEVLQFATKNSDMTMVCFNSGVEMMRYKLNKKLNGKDVLIVYYLNDTGYTWYPEDIFDVNIVMDYEVEEINDTYILGVEL